MSAATDPAPSLLPVAGAMLESLHAHRLLSARQLRELHAPHATLRWTQRALALLTASGLVTFARAGRGGRRIYHLTASGAEAVEQLPGHRQARRGPSAVVQAAEALSAHTLAVNESAIAFVKAARARGDECGPLAWRHEIAHPTGPPKRGAVASW